MDTEKKPTRSFSIRRSLDGARFRRGNLHTADSPEPPEPVPSIPAHHLPTTSSPPDVAQHESSRPESGGAPATVTQISAGTKPPALAPDASPQPEKSHRRRSVRDFFRSAVGRRSGMKGTPATIKEEKKPKKVDPPVNRVTPALSPSPPTSAAPLAAHPLPELADSQVLSPVQLQQCFKGAPEFSVRSPAGQRPIQVVVTYKDSEDETTEMRTDVARPMHTSFTLATSSLESPSMRSANGIEPGTVGLEYILQLGLPAECRSTSNADLSQSRALLRNHPERLGLRSPNLELVIDRLGELSDQRAAQLEDSTADIGEQRAAEMYAELFGKLLMPPKYNSASESDPTGLAVQVGALVDVLSRSGLWFDMSLSGERARLGERLWAADGLVPESDAAVDRDVLLLQITLAGELLIRIAERELKISQTKRKSKSATPKLPAKVQWDLMLADRFLKGVSIRPSQAAEPKAQNRSSVFSMLSFVTARETFEDDPVQPVIVPRGEKAQLDGLLAFARALEWPHADELKDGIPPRLVPDSKSTPGTQPGSPALKTNDVDSYFGVLIRSDGAQSSVRSSRLTLTVPIEPTPASLRGYAARSWLAGLVLPDDEAPRLLMSSLLAMSTDHTPDAPFDLNGGFFHKERSYWSKSSVVGRVLAAEEAARYCMGWISVPRTESQQDCGNKWFSTRAEVVTSTSKSRITTPDLIVRDSALIPGGDIPVHETDLIWPADTPLNPNSKVLNHTLSLPADAPAVMTFAPCESRTESPSTLPLKYDVHFITSQPCFPSPRTARLPVHDPGDQNKALPAPPCHPLHISIPFRQVPASILLSPLEAQDELITSIAATAGEGVARRDSAAGRSPLIGSARKDGREVLVLDCREQGSQILGRAWCSAVGVHALVARERRTCISCSVREARGLDVRVVLRV